MNDTKLEQLLKLLSELIADIKVIEGFPSIGISLLEAASAIITSIKQGYNR